MTFLLHVQIFVRPLEHFDHAVRRAVLRALIRNGHQFGQSLEVRDRPISFLEDY